MLALGTGATSAGADVPVHVDAFPQGLHSTLPTEPPAKGIGEPFTPGGQQIHAAALDNDEPGGALLMGRDFTTVQDTTGAGLSAGEPHLACNDPDSGTPALVATVWYRFKGTGGNVLINTLGSDFDTVLAVYRSTSLDPTTAFCDDDFPGQTWSEVYMPTVAGADYLIQVGGCGGGGCGASTGDLQLTVLGSDERRSPGPLAANGIGSTIGTYIDSVQEPRTCQGVGYASTLWYRFTVSRPGTVSFTMNTNDGGFRPVARIYPVASTTPLPSCGVGTGASPIASFKQYVQAGTYLIQIGGVNGEWGLFSYTFSFAPNNNVDGDPENWPADCNDNDKTVYHGAHDGADGKNNDCDAFTDEDYDGDFFESRTAGGKDCNDRNRHINPDAKERKGNRVDEDCDNVKEDWPELEVNVAPFVEPDGGVWRFRTLPIGPLPKGSRLRVSCSRGGCPRGSYKKRFKRRVANFTGAISYARRIAMGRRTVVEVRITARHKQGKVVQFKLRRTGGRLQPKRFEKCLRLGSRRASKCA
jgi:hypothetical protein